MKHQRGGALVEFAIAAPLMLLMFFGAIQFGWLVYSYHAAGYAARIGARYAAVRGADCKNTTGTDAQGNTLCPITAAAVSYYVKNSVSGLQSGATVTPTWTTPPWGNSPPSGCAQATQTPGCMVTVTIGNNGFVFSVPYVRNVTLQLNAQSSEIVQN